MTGVCGLIALLG